MSTIYSNFSTSADLTGPQPTASRHPETATNPPSGIAGRDVDQDVRIDEGQSSPQVIRLIASVDNPRIAAPNPRRRAPMSTISRGIAGAWSVQDEPIKRLMCPGCGFSYDEALGLPEHGIAPGTPNGGYRVARAGRIS
jgi:rubredoxin